ncbi:MAG: Asp-tRNA(Asn)/Glu-tRNA(Gln) amidotransferase subunit GatA [Clostridiales bacterium]|jgi:aspartyl-tRNA(Asn)/glutamyl-tRNA(Gln) amidotransferase subunit A|nr:Asp-tRNA(Asn)/Glu-tRNA(Gln) amidotransferase subunit GatA [Clostridiales bacterium]
MDISELRVLMDKKEISSAEVVKTCLERISASDNTIGAFLHINPKALETAAQAQKRIDAGHADMFTGIPVGLKDNLCTMDMPTTCASRMLEGFTPPYDAAVVEKLRAQGAVLIGKLNMDEFAMGASTSTSYYKKTRNPFDITRVPGGSSGGSAAAVSAGFCAVSLGSDTGGSIRQPASFCGVSGLRPTYGRVSRYGCVAFASSLDQIGPIASSAKDCALLLTAIEGKDTRDQTSTEGPPARIRDVSLKGKRLGLIEELIVGDVEDETLAAVESAALWYEKQGAFVESVSLPMLKYAVPAYYLISSAEASANLSRFDGVRYGYRPANPESYESLVSGSRRDAFGWEVKRRIMLGSYALCSGYYDDYYKRAVRLADVIRSEYDKAFETYDALLSPVSPMAAFTFDNIPTDPARLYLADICTVSAALAGLPALSTPCGYTGNGLPVGLMITGARWDDYGILSLADAFERAFNRKRPAFREVGQ